VSESDPIDFSIVLAALPENEKADRKYLFRDQRSKTDGR
jgi:hypothetical protein